jgi:hypothetical protein
LALRWAFAALTFSPATARSTISWRSCSSIAASLDLALLVERRADDLLQHVVADLRGFAVFWGNGGAVAAGLFRMNVDEGQRLLSRILRLSTLVGLRPSASGAPFRLRVLHLIEPLALLGQRSALSPFVGIEAPQFLSSREGRFPQSGANLVGFFIP